MCTKTDLLPVLTLDDYDANNKGFILLSLQDFFEKNAHYPKAHKATYYTLLYSQYAEGDMYIDARQFSINHNTVVCIAPHSVNRFEFKNSPMGFVILFSETFFSLRYNENVLYQFQCLKNNSVCFKQLVERDNEIWNFYIKQIKEEYNERSKMSIGILRSHLNIMLSLLEKDLDSALIQTSVVNEKDKKIQLFKQLLEDKYKKEKRPSFYAKQLFISVNYLNRICKEKTGLSSGDLIRNRVIMEAERLLVHTFLSISEIADELEFKSTSYFVTFFKKHIGSTPETYRKVNK